MEQKLIVFDLDGTLTPTSTWYALNMRLGITPEEDTELFERYLKETMSYAEWMRELMELYRKNSPVTKSEIVAFAEHIELRPDAQQTIDAVKAKGYTPAIISGSVDIIISTIAQKLGIEIWFAKTNAVFNEKDELVNIETNGDGERDEKLRQLETYCQAHGLDIKEVLCVEDGGNGLELFKHAKGILFGDNPELVSLAWKQVTTLSEIINVI